MATAAEMIEESETSVRLRARMTASPGVELLWDLIAVGGYDLKDPLFRKGVYFEQFKQDAVDCILRVALAHRDHPRECWHSAVTTFGELNAELQIIESPGIEVPSYDCFNEQLRNYEVSEGKAIGIGEDSQIGSLDGNWFKALEDEEYHFMQQCRRVAARRQEIRDRDKPLAPLREG